jgi:hypothetical protein
MRGFLVIDDSDSRQAAAAASAISLILALRQIDGTAKWYYTDETLDGSTEYGVVLDIPGNSPEIVEQMRSIWQLCVQQFEAQEIRLEISL